MSACQFLEMPWPPSVNTYWRHPNKGPLAGRTLVSEKGRAYRTDCQALALRDKWPAFDAASRLKVQIIAFPPDKRRRDLDNVLKAALDALTQCGVWGDDSQIDQLEIIRKPKTNGVLCVAIWKLAE